MIDLKRKMTDEDSQVCRDFMRGTCTRGKRCKFEHPNRNSDDQRESDSLVFCHDFQNQGCTRLNCKFAHFSKQEESAYKQTGSLPEASELKRADVPVCKDFINGQCTRGERCRYRHEVSDVTRITSVNITPPPPAQPQLHFSLGPPPPQSHHDLSFAYDYDIKRRRMIDGYEYIDARVLVEETSMLRRKIASLEKQVVDLTSTNEVLLEQNARYRMINKSMSMSPGSLPALPAGSLVSMSQPIVTPAVTLATLANTCAPQPLQSLHLTDTVQTVPNPAVGLNGDIPTQQPQAASIAAPTAAPTPAAAAAPQPLQPAMHQQIQPTHVQALPAATPGVAPVSMTQQGVVPVTMTQQVTQQVVPVSMTQQVVPVSLTQALAPMVSLASNHTPSSSMVSYPMVSRSIQQS